jgi:hypothetical protein
MQVTNDQNARFSHYGNLSQICTIYKINEQLLHHEYASAHSYLCYNLNNFYS